MIDGKGFLEGVELQELSSTTEISPIKKLGAEPLKVRKSDRIDWSIFDQKPLKIKVVSLYIKIHVNSVNKTSTGKT